MREAILGLAGLLAPATLRVAVTHSAVPGS